MYLITFSKAPNYGVDPELAVVTGASIQAGVISGGWPLQVCVEPSNMLSELIIPDLLLNFADSIFHLLLLLK